MITIRRRINDEKNDQMDTKMFKNWTKMIKNNEKSDQMDTENDHVKLDCAFEKMKLNFGILHKIILNYTIIATTNNPSVAVSSTATTNGANSWCD